MPATSAVWLVSNHQDSPIRFALMRAFDTEGFTPVPRAPTELLSWIRLFEDGTTRASVPRLIILDAESAGSTEHTLLRTLRGRSPWSGIPTLVYGPAPLEETRKNFYRAGISAFLLEPPPQELDPWVRSIAQYWVRVAVLPSSRPYLA